MTVPSTGLVMPANYATRRGLGLSTGRIGDLHLTDQVDDELKPMLWLLTWQFATPEQVDAIWQHYDQHFHGTFKWLPPQGDGLRTFQWITAPSVQWTTPRSASVTGEIEQVLAFIP
jgi:hypothetical protein